MEHCVPLLYWSTYSSLSHVTHNHPNWKELLDQAPPITIPKPHCPLPYHLLLPLEPAEPQSDLEDPRDPNDVNYDDPMAPQWPPDESDDDSC